LMCAYSDVLNFQSWYVALSSLRHFISSPAITLLGGYTAFVIWPLGSLVLSDRRTL
jgi:hypothetical protein